MQNIRITNIHDEKSEVITIEQLLDWLNDDDMVHDIEHYSFKIEH